jgi:hypothetical protein
MTDHASTYTVSLSSSVRTSPAQIVNVKGISLYTVRALVLKDDKTTQGDRVPQEINHPRLRIKNGSISSPRPFRFSRSRSSSISRPSAVVIHGLGFVTFSVGGKSVSLVGQTKPLGGSSPSKK